MRRRNTVFVVTLLVLFLVWVLAVSEYAGNTDPTNPPGSTVSYTLEDIYNRLNAGTMGAQSTFTEPTSGPGTPTMHSLNEIIGVAPAKDDANGAIPADVASGKTFWGLTSGEWGTKTGTVAVGSNVLGAEGLLAFPIPDGIYSGKTSTAQDVDLVPGNIKCGVTIFGVTGSILQYVAKTGQTASYATGDDGDYRNGGLPAVAPSSGSFFGGYNRTSFTCSGGFTDNGNGTATDNQTGLMWTTNANHGDNSWQGAIDYCNNYSFAGYDDWRLPNLNELRSLFDPGLSSPYLPVGHPFTGVQSDVYWSSTTYADHPIDAWYVYLVNGRVNHFSKGSSVNVWPVRGGQ